MGLDIRMPIGLMFGTLGLLMVFYGVATNGSEIYARSLGINVNIDWGIVMILFACVMLALGRKKPQPAPRGESEV